MKRCLKCNAMYDDHMRYCINCGGQLQTGITDVKTMPLNQIGKDNPKQFPKLFQAISIVNIIWGGAVGILMFLCVVGIVADSDFNSSDIITVIMLGAGGGLLLSSGILGVCKECEDICILLDSLYVLIYIVMLFRTDNILFFTIFSMVVIPIAHIVFCDKEDLKRNRLFLKFEKQNFSTG